MTCWKTFFLSIAVAGFIFSGSPVRQLQAQQPAAPVQVDATLLNDLQAGDAAAANTGGPADPTQPPEIPAAPGRPSAMLFLRNGDYLHGEILDSADPTRFRWQASHFRAPVAFAAQSFDRIVFDSVEQNLASDARHRIRLVDGQLLYGEVVQLDESQVVVESNRHGKMTLSRRYVERIDNMSDNGHILWDGLDAKRSWTVPASREHEMDEWSLDASGLHTQNHHAHLYRAYDHSGPLAVELELRSDRRVRFLVALDSVASQVSLRSAFSLETWGSRLVVHRQAGEKLEHLSLPLPALRESGATVRLQVFFHPEKRQVLVFADGERLGEFVSEVPRSDRQAGVYLRNQAQQMSVLRFRLRRWDGETLPVIDAESTLPQVWLADGQVVRGEIVGYDREGDKLRIREASTREREVARNEVEAVRLFPAGDKTPAPLENEVVAHYAGGARLRGKFLRVVENGIEVESPAVASTFVLGYDGAQRFEFKFPPMQEESDASMTVLTGDRCRIHGRMVASDNAGEMRWHPQHSDDITSINWHKSERLTFDVADTNQSRREPDRVYLMNGDIVPCQFLGDDGTMATLRIGEATELSVARTAIKAVEMLEHPSDGSAILSRDWKTALGTSDEASEVSPDGIEFHGAGSVWSDADLPPSFHLRADCHWRVLTRDKQDLVFGFGDGEGEGDELQFSPYTGKYMEVTISRTGNTLTAAMMSSSMYNGMGPGSQMPLVSTIDIGNAQAMSLDLYADRERRQYALYVNGLHLVSWHDRGGTRPRGEVLVVACRSENARALDVTLSRVAMSPWAGMLDEGQLQRILTRRPGMKPDEVTHVIRGRNGDHLRGELSVINAEHVVVKSRRESITIPRQNVAEIISLAPFDAPPPKGVTANQGQEAVLQRNGIVNRLAGLLGLSGQAAPLNVPSETTESGLVNLGIRDGGWLTLEIVKSGSDVLVGRSASLGEIAIPWPAVWAIDSHVDNRGPYRLVAWRLLEPPPPPEELAEESADGSSTEPAPPELVGKEAPAFTLGLLDGTDWKLADQRGKVVVLDFWATWCGPCVRALPEVTAAVAQFPADKVTLVGVNQQEAKEQIDGFLTAHQLQLPVALDGEGAIAQQYGIQGLPTTVIVGPDGKVAAVQVGAHPEMREWLAGEIETLLAPPAANPAPTQ